MATVITSIGSNQSIDTAVPSTCSGAGPTYDVTWNKTLSSSVVVGDICTAFDFASSSTYTYLITVIAGSTYTLRYITDTGGTGDDSPCDLCDDAYCNDPPTFTFKRAYTTMTLWEADLDDTDFYSSSDDAVGECHNDSTFDESLVINGGGTVSLSSRKLSVHSSSRHDGTAGSGARNVYTGSSQQVCAVSVNNTTVEWLEYDNSGAGAASRQIVIVTTDIITGINIKNLIIHGVGNTTANTMGIGIQNGGDTSNTRYIMNNIIYDIDDSSVNCFGIFCTNQSDKSELYNNTVFGTGSGSGDGFGFNILDADVVLKNNISMDSAGGTASDFNITGSPTRNNNMSSDATATGTNSLINKISSDQFVSTTGGSEDLHLKAEADALVAGVDLGTTPTNVNIDINGFDRDGVDLDWDIGAHQFTTSAGGNGSFVMFIDT